MRQSAMNIFSIEAVKREQEQARLQKQVTVPEKKVPMNITLSVEHKEKLKSYARKKHLSASIIIQMWIDDFCV